MGVVHFKEVTGRTASEDIDTNRDYTRTFQALAADPLDGADVVRNYPDVPSRGAIYSYVDAAGITRFDANSVCVSVRVAQDDAENFQNWTVTAEYRGLDDPTAQPPEVEWDPVHFQEAKLKDTLGSPYVNKAGDPFENGRLVDSHRFTLSLVQNVVAGDWDPIAMQPYQDSLNSQPFLTTRYPPGLASGTCKLVIGAKLVWYPDRINFYWRRTAKIEYKAEGWVGKIRNAGYNVKLAGGIFGGVPVPYIAANGTRPTQPVLLDNTGAKLAVGLDPIELPFADYNTRAWGTLNLEY